jgi:tetratricopeptide (TPR) repeat protein
MEQIPAVLSQLGDHRLEVQFTTDILGSARINPIFSPEHLIAQGISHCNHFDDPVLVCESNINLTLIHLITFAIAAKFYMAAGFHHFYFGSNQNMGLKLLEMALKLSRPCEDTDTQCSILTTLAAIKLGTGDHGTARTHVDEARRLANLSGNLFQEARALRVLAQCTRQLSDYRSSIVHLHRAKEILDICGLAGGWLETNIKGTRAEVHLLKSEYTDAKKIHTQSLQLSNQDPFTYAFTWLNIAQIDVMLGTGTEEVQQNLNEAKSILCAMKYFYGITWCGMVLADLKLGEDDTISAEHLLQDCLNSTWQRHTDAVSFCLERFADRSSWCAAELTSTWHAVYLGYAKQSKDKLALHKALLFLGDAAISQEDDRTAHTLFTVALEGFVCMDVHHSRAQCLLRLGDLASKQGNLSEAATLWTEARPLFERSSQAKAVEHIDARLAELGDNQKVLVVHLATLHPLETSSTGPSVETAAPGQNPLEGAILSVM